MARIIPFSRFSGLPCSYVGVACAYEDIYGKEFDAELPPDLRDDGYLSLDAANRFIRQHLPVKKKQYFKRSERMSLSEFLETDHGRCCVCVYGHFIYLTALHGHKVPAGSQE